MCFSNYICNIRLENPLKRTENTWRKAPEILYLFLSKNPLKIAFLLTHPTQKCILRYVKRLRRLTGSDLFLFPLFL